MYLTGMRRGGDLKQCADITWGKVMFIFGVAHQMVWLGGKWRYLSLKTQQDFGIWSDRPSDEFMVWT